MEEKIYFYLDTRIPEKITASYMGRTESIAISIVPEVIAREDSLLYEEQIYLAEKYLRAILINQ